jgi:hypothetical protein
VIEDDVPDVFLVGNAVPDNIPHGNPHSAKDAVKHKAVGHRNLYREKIYKIKHGKVDPHDEGPQTKINGNGFFIEKYRMLHASQLYVQ